MTEQPHPSPSPSRAGGVANRRRQLSRPRLLEEAADRGRLAPSVHNTQPWTFVLHADRLELRADRARQLTALDPSGRELLQSAGAALLNVRVALAARRWACVVDRLPRADDADLLAVVRPVDGEPDATLIPLERAIPLRHTNRRPFDPLPAPADLVQALAQAAVSEAAAVAPVRVPGELRLLASLTLEAARSQEADPAYRAELAAWTNRTPADGDGVPCDVLPHARGDRLDQPPLRDFHPRMAGLLPRHRGSGSASTLLVLTTEDDGPRAWLRSGEALERVLLELTRRGWSASPISQPLEVPTTRARLHDLTGAAHPQMVLRIGRAAVTSPTPRRPRGGVVVNSTRSPAPLVTPAAGARPRTSTLPQPGRRPASDGRGGTTWV